MPRYEIRPSNIPNAGMGVFARTPYTRGERIGQYKGKLLSKNEVLNNPDLDCRYMMKIRRGKMYIDGSNLKKNPMGYLNYAKRGEGSNLICKELVDGRVYFYATRDIREGEELLFDYGFNPVWLPCTLKS